MLGKVLLYRGAQCKGAPVKLEGSMGAQSGAIAVLGGGMHPDILPEALEPGTVVGADPSDPTADMLRWTRSAMQADGFDPAAIAKCNARREPSYGPDAWVVDEVAGAAAAPSEDGPRSACGQFGYTQESEAYWRIAHGVAMHFEMGQDAYKDFDPRSLTLIERNAAGQWVPVVDVAGSPPAAPAAGVSTGAASGVSSQGNTTSIAKTSPAQTAQATPAAPPLPAAPPAAAANAAGVINDGVINIANMPGVVEQPYGETRGWRVVAGFIGGAFQYCAGEIDAGGVRFRLGFGGGQWQVALPSNVPADYYGQFAVDGRVKGMSGTADGNWAFGWIGIGELDAIRTGNMMVLDVGRGSFDLPLKGTAATITKIEECVARSGQPTS